MTRRVLALVPLLLPAGATQRSSAEIRLDRSRAFFYPGFAAAAADAPICRTGAVEIPAATYLRYLAARFGTRWVEDLVFDVALARECRARGLARAAPSLARPLGARRLLQSGRSGKDPDGSFRRKFVNEALRQQRVDALVRAERKRDEATLRAVFDSRYGVGGQRVRVRHVLVSFRATRRRLGATVDRTRVEQAARERADELHRRLQRGATFADLVRESDDRATRRELRSAATRAGAGFLRDYNYVRFGETFAAAVRALPVGGTSAPVRTSLGFHLVRVVSRKVTRFEDVAVQLRREIDRRPTSPAETLALRRRLLRKYGR